jgi:topoisomerase-4 subunit A
MIEVSPSAPIEHILGAPLDQNYLLAACDGYGFVASQGDMNTRQKAGKQFVTIEDGKKLLKPLALRPDDQYVGLLSEQGRFLVVDIKELKVLSKGGRGTVLIKLNDGDTLSQWVAFGEAGLAVSGGESQTSVYHRDGIWICWPIIWASAQARARPCRSN